MKKLINQPENFVEETIEGILLAYPDFYTTYNDEKRAIIKKNIKPGKVAIVTGGGSGHLPLFLGYVGDGLADGCAVGNVFASPSAKVMFDCTLGTDQGAGVLYLFGNYGGDSMNFDLAAELAEEEHIKTMTLKGNDDVASAPKPLEKNRRGVAGIFFAYKIAGAAAERGYSLKEVYDVTKRAIGNIRSMGVAISACTIPEVGHPSFVISENEMELGMGIHGEPGIIRCEMKTADEVAEYLIQKILADIDLEAGDKIALLVNGLGSTPREELFIMNRKANMLIHEKGISIYKTFIGEYATSMEMGGLSLSVMKLDDELTGLLDDHAYSPLLTPWEK